MRVHLQKVGKKLSHYAVIVLVILTMAWNHAIAVPLIQITSATDLAKIGNDPAYPLSGYYEQTADIDLSGYTNWTPIGTFTGSYDGQYHSISNLTINGANKGYQGLFSQVGTNGEIKNLHLSNVNIDLSGSSDNIGALAGYNNGNIYRVIVNNGSVKGYYYVGGLVGRQLGTANISECYANVAVEDNGYINTIVIPGVPGTPGSYIPMGPGMPDMWMPGTPGTPDQYIDMKGSDLGALLGENQNGGTVTNCYATGNVTGSEDVGGLVGYNTANGSSISKSYASSVVTSSNGKGGGFIGLNGGDASDCYWDITTSGQTNASWNTPNIATGKTNAEMKQQTTFVGWDFNNVWEIENGVSQPTLKWMSLAPLPVSLLSFKAHAQAESIKLTWQTVSESINKEFIIYRSGDQKKFELLTRIAGSGNATSLKNYNYYDEQPLAGNNYYKLAQVDENGKETELGISTAYFGFSEIADLQIFPNPVEDEVNVSFGTKKYTAFSITDLNGKMLQNMRLKKDENGLSTSMKNYVPGIYLFQFNGEEGSVTKKVLKK